MCWKWLYFCSQGHCCLCVLPDNNQSLKHRKPYHCHCSTTFPQDGLGGDQSTIFPSYCFWMPLGNCTDDQRSNYRLCMCHGTNCLNGYICGQLVRHLSSASPQLCSHFGRPQWSLALNVAGLSDMICDIFTDRLGLLGVLLAIAERMRCSFYESDCMGRKSWLKHTAETNWSKYFLQMVIYFAFVLLFHSLSVS